MDKCINSVNLYLTNNLDRESPFLYVNRNPVLTHLLIIFISYGALLATFQGFQEICVYACNRLSSSFIF